jgi:hypothetical protein
LLDHVNMRNERNLRRSMKDYVGYYRDNRLHLALSKGTPSRRNADEPSGTSSGVVSMPRLGGLHHRYDLAA